jgi:hypothetical protein
MLIVLTKVPDGLISAARDRNLVPLVVLAFLQELAEP